MTEGDDRSPNPVPSSSGSPSTAEEGGVAQSSLPRIKKCPMCDASYTRTAHLNRHIKTHTREGLHACDICQAQFTRTDVLSKHKTRCIKRQTRRRACQACSRARSKCNLESPCERCSTRGFECVYQDRPRTRTSPSESASQYSATTSGPGTSSVATSDYDSALTSLGPSAPGFGALYEGNMFDALFGEVFGEGVTVPAAAFPFDAHPLSIPVPGSTSGPLPPGFTMAGPMAARGAPPLYDSGLPTDEELAQYEYLFYTEFLPQAPLIHTPTFRAADHPPVVLQAFRACGAIFVRTPRANEYMRSTTMAVRDTLAREFAVRCQGTTVEDDQATTYLLIAAHLLQVLGMFHHEAEDRASANMFHGMIVMMIRRTEMIARTSRFAPEDFLSSAFMNADGDTAWRRWVAQEEAKRALLMSYMHDACHVIFFALAPSWRDAEFAALALPCEDALWYARSAGEWRDALCAPAAFGPAPVRLAGLPVQRALASMRATVPAAGPPAAIPALGHVLLLHVVLADLFVQATPAAAERSRGSRGADTFVFQYALHNWLQSWMAGPETPGEGAEGPLLYANCLPLYWLGQLAVTAFQEPLAPFVEGGGVEGHFELVRGWLGRVRAFVWKGSRDRAQTLLWDGMMKIRLQAGMEEGLGAALRVGMASGMRVGS